MGDPLNQPASQADADGTSLTISQSNCQPSASTAGDFQTQFQRRGPVWGGGDGAEPIPIDQGRTVWLFGDTYVGGGPTGGPLSTIGFVHNTMAVQYDGSCFLYLFRSDSNHRWYSAIADPTSEDYYWPASGSFDPVSGDLSIMAWLVHVDIPGDPWGWHLVGVDVIRYHMNPVMTRVSSERLFTYGTADRARFGSDLIVDGGRVYLHGCAQSEPTTCYLARTDLGLHRSSLQFLSDAGWVPSVGQADPIGLESPVGTQLHVVRMGDGYVGTNQIPLMSTKAAGWWAPNVTGPFRPIGTVVDTNAGPDGPLHSNWFTYGGRTIMTSAGGIGVFSVNTSDAEGATIAGIYGPRFVTIAPHVVDRNPFGNLDSATTRTSAAEVVGWAYDPDTAASVTVRVSIDGVPGPSIVANVPRPDVAVAIPGAGPNRGFDSEVPLAPGLHRICATAINQNMGATDQLLGCAMASGAGTASDYHPIDPTRILDSRFGVGGYSSRWSTNQSRPLVVAGVGGVPTSATAVVVNMTVTNTSAAGYLTVAPLGGVLPNASSLNFGPGDTATNLVTVQIGASGALAITSLEASTDVIADVVGYYDGTDGDRFVPLSPARILDSRNGTGGPANAWAPGEVRPLAVAGVGPVPADATAVVMNVTATNPTTTSWLRVGPSGRPPTVTSNLNFVAGETVPNLVVVAIGDDGSVDLSNAFGRVDVVADVVGYFTPTTGGVFVPLTPTRLLDSRFGTGGYTTPWGSGTRSLKIGGVGPVPTGATAVVLNITVTNPSSDSWMRVSPTGQPFSATSNLNFTRGQTIPNLVVVGLGTSGQIDVYNLLGRVDVIADLVGYYRAPG